MYDNAEYNDPKTPNLLKNTDYNLEIVDAATIRPFSRFIERSRIHLIFEAINSYHQRLSQLTPEADEAKWERVIQIYDTLHTQEFVTIWNTAAQEICDKWSKDANSKDDIEMLIILSLREEYKTGILELIELLITDATSILKSYSEPIMSYVPNGKLLLLTTSVNSKLENVTFPGPAEIIIINGKQYNMVGIVWGNGVHFVAEINIIIPSENRLAGLYLCDDKVTTKIEHWRCDATKNKIPKLIMLEQVPVVSGGSHQPGKQPTPLTKHNQKNKSKNKSKNKTRRIRN